MSLISSRLGLRGRHKVEEVCLIPASAGSADVEVGGGCEWNGCWWEWRVWPVTTGVFFCVFIDLFKDLKNNCTRMTLFWCLLYQIMYVCIHAHTLFGPHILQNNNSINVFHEGHIHLPVFSSGPPHMETQWLKQWTSQLSLTPKVRDMGYDSKKFSLFHYILVITFCCLCCSLTLSLNIYLNKCSRPT